MERELEDEKLRLLAAFPQLVAISDPGWQEVVAAAEPMKIPQGMALLTQESRCRNFLLLFDGVVRVEQTSEAGRDIVLYRVHPGEVCILAVRSMMDGAPFNARAVSETPIEALNLSLEQFEYALAHSGGFRRFILTTMAVRLRDVMTLVQDIAFQRLDSRLASTLHELFARQSGASLQITHQQLAMELGSTREVVSRLLKDFEDKTGCIRLRRGRIELLSRATLEAYARKLGAVPEVS